MKPQPKKQKEQEPYSPRSAFTLDDDFDDDGGQEMQSFINPSQPPPPPPPHPQQQPPSSSSSVVPSPSTTTTTRNVFMETANRTLAKIARASERLDTSDWNMSFTGDGGIDGPTHHDHNVATQSLVPGEGAGEGQVRPARSTSGFGRNTPQETGTEEELVPMMSADDIPGTKAATSSPSSSAAAASSSIASSTTSSSQPYPPAPTLFSATPTTIDLGGDRLTLPNLSEIEQQYKKFMVPPTKKTFISIVGIIGSLMLYSYLQEKIMTTPYGKQSFQLPTQLNGTNGGQIAGGRNSSTAATTNNNNNKNNNKAGDLSPRKGNKSKYSHEDDNDAHVYGYQRMIEKAKATRSSTTMTTMTTTTTTGMTTTTTKDSNTRWTTLTRRAMMAVLDGSVSPTIITSGMEVLDELGSKSSSKDTHIPIYFTYSFFLVLNNRFVSALVALFVVLVRRDFTQLKPVAPIHKHCLVSISSILATMLQYECLRYITFPTQSVAKCAKMIPLMAWSIFFKIKKYKWIDFGTAAFVIFGVGLFVTGGNIQAHHVSSKDAWWGIFLIFLHVLIAGFSSSFQERVFSGYTMTMWNQMFYVNTAACVLSVLFMALRGTMSEMLLFLRQYPRVIFDTTVLSCSAMSGQFAVIYTIKEFGAFIYAAIITLRQFLSIILSDRVFDHSLSGSQWMAAIIVFGSLFLKSWFKADPSAD